MNHQRQRTTRNIGSMLCVAWLLASCNVTSSVLPSAATPALHPVPSLMPTAAAADALAPTRSSDTTAPENSPDTGWLQGSAGIELRRLQLGASAEHAAASLAIVRLDPAAVRLRVGYAPAQPQPIGTWMEQQQSLLVVNGSFFTPSYQATALVISDGVTSGTSYEGFGGMLGIAPDGTIAIRSLRDQPYQPDEALSQAVQSFPMLLFPGGIPAELDEDGDRSRRTVVAQDRGGRLLFVVCSTRSFTLRELVAWLAASDLDLDRALNLDGGRSTSLALADGELREQIDAFDLLPLVLVVERASGT